MKKLGKGEDEIQLPTLPSSVLIDSPNDRDLQHRDHLNSFQKKHRGFVPIFGNTLPDIGKRHLFRQDLNCSAPFRIQSKELIQTKGSNSIEDEMEKPDTLNNIRYWSKKYKRLSHTLTDIKTKHAYSWPKIEKQKAGKQSYMATKSENRRPLVSPSISSDTLSSRSIETRTNTPFISYKSSGTSSNVNVNQTLAEFLVRYGYDKSTLCSVAGTTSQVLLSRIDSYVVDTSGYEEFARRKEKTVMEKIPRNTPRYYNDYSVSKSELGPCFPIFVSEDSPVRKCGRVLR